MLSITNHQGNANQNHNEMSPPICQNYYYQQPRGESLGDDVKKGSPCDCWWECKLCAAPMENSVEVPRKIKKQNYHMIQKFYLLFCIQRKWNQYLKEIRALLCSLQRYPQNSRQGNNKEWMDYKCDIIHTQWNFIRLKRKEIQPFMVTWMSLENITISEISHTKKDKFCMILSICGI